VKKEYDLSSHKYSSLDVYISFHMVLSVLLSTHRIVPNYKLKTRLTLSDMNSEHRD